MRTAQLAKGCGKLAAVGTAYDFKTSAWSRSILASKEYHLPEEEGP